MAVTIATRETAGVASAPADRKFPGLDVLRGWAAISILLLHASTPINPAFLKSGYIAVDLFFVMSGFVIAHAYDKRMRTLGALGFIRVRVIRFYPLLALGLVIGTFRCLMLIPLSNAPYGALNVLQAFAYNLLFLPAPPLLLSSVEIAPLDGPAWSLIFEMAINLAYAVLFKWLSVRVLISIVSVSLVALVYWALACRGLIVGPGWPTIGGGAARVCFSFPLGILMYRLDLPPIKLGFLVLPGLLAIVCLGGSTWTDLALVVFASPALVAVAAGSIPRWVSLSAYLGATSYCLYVIHAPIIMLVDGVSHRLGIALMWPTLFVIAALLLVCPLLDRWYDRPVRRWLSALTRSSFTVGASH